MGRNGARLTASLRSPKRFPRVPPFFPPAPPPAIIRGGARSQRAAVGEDGARLSQARTVLRAGMRLPHLTAFDISEIDREVRAVAISPRGRRPPSSYRERITVQPACA